MTSPELIEARAAERSAMAELKRAIRNMENTTRRRETLEYHARRARREAAAGAEGAATPAAEGKAAP
ncbi:MAG TPA: hypothetical protein VGP07_11780 [Polyangia bacterium]|jgi:hypothetical protein